MDSLLLTRLGQRAIGLLVFGCDLSVAGLFSRSIEYARNQRTAGLARSTEQPLDLQPHRRRHADRKLDYSWHTSSILLFVDNRLTWCTEKTTANHLHDALDNLRANP